jgi:anti-sigma factor RsiW
MQESLDMPLAKDEQHELHSHLDDDYADADEYRRLREVDRRLQNCQMMPAPRALALNIMAKIAEGFPQPQLSRLSGLALALALALVTLVLLPVIIGVLWLVVNAIGNAAALTGLAQSIGNLATLIVAGLESLILSAQSLLEMYPLTPALILTLLPVGWFWARRGWRRPTAAL